MYEELSFNSFPALQTQLYDGWVLRFANGFGNRANSISAVYPSKIDVRDKINECEGIYARAGLPAVFKITDAADEGYDGLLAGMGYGVLHSTDVMAVDLRGKQFDYSDCEISDNDDDEWFDLYYKMNNYTDDKTKETIKAIARNTVHESKYVKLVKDGVFVACGSFVAERGYMALLNVTVASGERGKGYGFELCSSLLAEAQRSGAVTGYLQVMQNNEAALSLYKKLGYKKLYSYWYRVKRKDGANGT
jgi:ribosomal protein S18 acetylase RimI-like enzyme